MKKLSANTIATIKAAFYGCANATSAWAGEMGYFKFSSAQGREMTEYGYRDYMLDEIKTAQLIEGKRIHGTGLATVYPVSLREYLQTVQTSILHHQMIKTNTYTVMVSAMELKIAELLRPIEQYVDIHLGESTDKFYSCRRRDLIITVKPEYRDSISLSIKHSLLDKNLKETVASTKERNIRKVFIN